MLFRSHSRRTQNFMGRALRFVRVSVRRRCVARRHRIRHAAQQYEYYRREYHHRLHLPFIKYRFHAYDYSTKNRLCIRPRNFRQLKLFYCKNVIVCCPVIASKHALRPCHCEGICARGNLSREKVVVTVLVSCRGLLRYARNDRGAQKARENRKVFPLLDAPPAPPQR